MNRSRRLLLSIAEPSTVRYFAIGGLSFFIDVGLLALLYQVAGLPLWLSTVLGFWTSVVANFLLQRRFAFRSAAPVFRSMGRYGILLGANTLFTVLVVNLAETTGLGYAVGKVASVLITTAWNLYLYRHWVFPPSNNLSAQAPKLDPVKDPQL